MTRLAVVLLVLASWVILGPRPTQGAEPSPTSTPTLHPATDAQLITLMTRFAKMPGLFARFTETKHIDLLAVPLVSEGTIHYAAPGRLLRRTTKPQPNDVLLLADELWFRDAQRIERVDLGANAIVRAFVGSFRALLAGDHQALQIQYHMTLRVGDQEHWELTLKPKAEALAKIITRIELSGKGLVLHRLVVVEATGDVGTTTFVDVDPKRRYSEQEAEQLFGRPG